MTLLRNFDIGFDVMTLLLDYDIGSDVMTLLRDYDIGFDVMTIPCMFTQYFSGGTCRFASVLQY